LLRGAFTFVAMNDRHRDETLTPFARRIAEAASKRVMSFDAIAALADVGTSQEDCLETTQMLMAGGILQLGRGVDFVVVDDMSLDGKSMSRLNRLFLSDAAAHSTDCFLVSPVLSKPVQLSPTQAVTLARAFPFHADDRESGGIEHPAPKTELVRELIRL